MGIGLFLGSVPCFPSPAPLPHRSPISPAAGLFGAGSFVAQQTLISFFFFSLPKAFSCPTPGSCVFSVLAFCLVCYLIVILLHLAWRTGYYALLFVFFFFLLLFCFTIFNCQTPKVCTNGGVFFSHLGSALVCFSRPSPFYASRLRTDRDRKVVINNSGGQSRRG